MPSHPYQHQPNQLTALIEQGFVLVYPNYKGTGESTGAFTWEGCVDTVIETAKYLKGGSGTGLFLNTTASWKAKEVYALGFSFGGSIVLTAAAKSNVLDAVISVAGPTDYRTHGKLPGVSEDALESIYEFIQRGMRNHGME